MQEPKYLIYVDGNGVNSNKYYNMIPDGDQLLVEYGRVDHTCQKKKYPIGKWRSIYNSKLKKGYKDITDLKSSRAVMSQSSDNKSFDLFYDHFSKYATSFVQKSFVSEGCTEAQLKEAQKVLDNIANSNDITVQKTNDLLLELFSIIPRRMKDVRHYLINNIEEKNDIISREQDALDSMDSISIIHKTDPYKELGIQFNDVNELDLRMLHELLDSTNKSSNRIYKAYQITNPNSEQRFNNFVSNTKNKECQYLIHGTRNPNVFSILKSGLLIRPTNAAKISGAAYGNGVYHSAHTQKSLGYCGKDNDKIFFIQNVNMGKPYTYEGWYRKGKDIDRSQMNYRDLRSMGYDSLYVKAGDGLLNSEYIVYNAEQTNTSFLVWMK